VSEALLVAEGISVHLGGAAVLRGASLAVAAGEILGVFGPSGAGKSTLFRALAGEERLTAGRVLLAGVDVTSRPLWQRARRGLGYVPQTPSVLLDLTVAENLAVFRRLAPRREGALTAQPVATDELLADLGLAGRAGVRAGALSGGERRRLELARALVAAPRVLLCDEPFAAIDPQGAERVGARLRALADGGGAVVLADHHVAAALRLCDRAALLLGGEIASVASPVEFCRDALVQKHYAVIPVAPPGPAGSPERQVPGEPLRRD
jgi:lipopolysaccharide export system ATP-binding protein